MLPGSWTVDSVPFSGECFYAVIAPDEYRWLVDLFEEADDL